MAIQNGFPQPSIPIVDLSAWTHQSSPASKKEAAKQLAAAMQINGCAGIKGHGIPAERLAKMFNTSRTLFDLPYEEKMKAPRPEKFTEVHGYCGIGRENAAGKAAFDDKGGFDQDDIEKMTDYKESFQVGSEHSEEPNIWLPEETLPGFREDMQRFYLELAKLADATMDALIAGLDLSESERQKVRANFTGDFNSIRLAHYPPRKIEPGKESTQSRLAPHTDWSYFTFLFQEDCGGLEFQDLSSKLFMPATPHDGVTYLSIGDMFERISNGIFPSAPHRVAADAKTSTRHRYSIPYFVGPGANDLIEPAESLITKLGKARYKPVTFVEYSAEAWKSIEYKAEV